MKGLIACEESGKVRAAFEKRGINVTSCDLLPSRLSGKHYQGNVMDIINNGWDFMIAFPPCTYLTTTANRSFINNPERWEKRLEAVKFVHALLYADIPHIAIENPKGVISTHIRKPDQYIHPYEHGHPISKMTGLWLKQLPLIQPTNIIEPEWIYPANGSKKRMSPIHAKNPSTKNPENAKLRSETFQGIADAMAEQWGNYLLKESK